MLTFISCAKTMAAAGPDAGMPHGVKLSLPHFIGQARQNAAAMSRYSPEELQTLLKVSKAIAQENHLRYNEFPKDDPNGPAGIPALFAYTGIVFQHLHPEDFTPAELSYAQEHLLITSFLYGLLRPLDAITGYRLEGGVRLPDHEGMTLFDWWKPLLTDYMISRGTEEGGVLVNLASGEMKRLMDWTAVESSLRVVTPTFHVLKGGKLTTPSVFAKMCRGEMTRFILKDEISVPEDLKAFSWNGFRYDASLSSDHEMVFVKG